MLRAVTAVLSSRCTFSQGDRIKNLSRRGIGEKCIKHLVYCPLLNESQESALSPPTTQTERVFLCLDSQFAAPSHQAFLRALAEHAADGGQRRRLQELCSKQGAADYNAYLREPNLGVLELLAAFPSCSPPLSLLIGTREPELADRRTACATLTLAILIFFLIDFIFPSRGREKKFKRIMTVIHTATNE